MLFAYSRSPAEAERLAALEDLEDRATIGPTEGSPTIVRALDRAGVEVIQVDFSESHKFAIAGLHCATLELVRDQG